MDFFLERNLSKIESDDTTGVSLVTEFLTEIAPEISAEVATIFDGTYNVKEFVDRYNLDKGLLKYILQERRQNIDSLINQLQENDEIRSQSSGYGVVDIFKIHTVNRTKPFQHTNDKVAQSKGTLNDLQYEKELVEKRDEEEMEEKNADLLHELETLEPESMKAFIDEKEIKSLIDLWNMHKKGSGTKRLKLEIQNSKVQNISVESPSTRAA